jgi:hypothetical protein
MCMSAASTSYAGAAGLVSAVTAAHRRLCDATDTAARGACPVKVKEAILLAVLGGLSGAIYWRSRATKVDHSNVNDEWPGGVAPAEPEPAAAA